MKKWILRCMLAVSLLLVICVTVGAIGEEKLPGDAGYGYSYRFVTRDTIEITAYTGYERNVTVPAEIDGYTVVGIAYFGRDEAIGQNPVVEQVTLPDTVRYIGAGAFAYWPRSDDTVSALREIVLPAGLEVIEENAFYNCFSLETVEVPASVQKIGPYAFANCGALQNFKLSGNQTVLQDMALGSILNAEGLIGMLQDAWYACQDDFFIWNGYLFGYQGESKTPVIPAGVRGIMGYAFCGRPEITAVTIPDSVEFIGSHTFENCTALTLLEIPASVTRIENGAFNDCSGLKSVTFHQGLRVIGEWAFEDCTALTEITLPEGLEELGDCAFGSCEMIQSMYFPSSLRVADVSAVQDTAWYNAKQEGELVYLGGVLVGFIGYDLPETLIVRPGTHTVKLENVYTDTLKTITLPDGLETLILQGTYTKLTSLTVPESVTYIDAGTFYELRSLKLPQEATLAQGSFPRCRRLESVTIPKGNPYLDAFFACDGLKSITLPDDVLVLSGGIGGKRLTSVDLNQVRVLGEGAFADCSALTRITLPESLVAIEGVAFSNCTALVAVQGGKNVRDLGYGCFAGCTALLDFGDLPDRVRRVDHTTFENTAWYQNQPAGVVYFGRIAYCYKGTMPEGTTLSLKPGTIRVTIGFIFEQEPLTPRTLAYFEQPNLVGVVLPESVREVGAYSLCNSPNIKAIDLGGAVSIGDNALNGTAVQEITLPDSTRFVGADALTGEHLKAVHLNDGLEVIEEGAFFSGTGLQGVQIPASVHYIGYHALGWAPSDTGWASQPIPGFTIRGQADSAAQRYAVANEFTFLEALPCTAHRYAETVVPATCQAGGYTRQVCTLCGDTQITAKTSATGHAAANDAAVAATCVLPGYTGGSHCAMCGTVLSQHTLQPALGHDWISSWVVEEPYQTGYGMTCFYCGRCQGYRYEPAGTQHVHHYIDSVVAPTCIDPGFTVHTCACGDTYIDSHVPQLGHDFVNGVCTRCGLSEADAPCDGGTHCPSARFTDVPTPSNWAHAGIDYAVSHSLFAGTSQTQFSPKGVMNRAMLVAVLWRMAGRPEPSTACPFQDVGPDTYYTKAVAWAAENGVVAGVSATRFDPAANITREQMAAILFRYAAKSGLDTSARGDTAAFPDRDRVAPYASDALRWCLAVGIISGSAENGTVYLAPQGSATREQVAAILMRYCKHIGA